MREDMSKVLVEEPRWGRAFARTMKGKRRQNRQRVDADGEGAPVHLGMKRDGGGQKWFGEHLGPLRRYLRQQVNRPWSKVYGELCAALDKRSVVQAHLFQHIRDTVEHETLWQQGEVWCHNWRGLVPIAESRAELFVHPLTGIVLVNRKRQQAQREAKAAKAANAQAPLAERREGQPGIAPGCQWHRVDGQWYEVRLGTLDPCDRKAKAYDLLLRREVGHGHRLELKERYGRGDAYAMHKRQLGHRELRRLNLAA